MSRKKITIYDMVIVGLFAAMVFVCTMFLGIRIPTPTGTTMLKTANAVCLLGGLLFGGVRGGLAAGLGSAIFDLTYPEYVAGAPITFVLYFIMGFVCGTIAHWGGNKAPSTPRMITAAACGAFGYSFMYIGKSIITLVLAGSAFLPAIIATAPKMLTTTINAVFAIVISCLLAPILRKRLMAAGLMKKFE
ncbi:MAG: ECF transporter S component [Angelakisella sp.]